MRPFLRNFSCLSWMSLKCFKRALKSMPSHFSASSPTFGGFGIKCSTPREDIYHSKKKKKRGDITSIRSRVAPFHPSSLFLFVPSPLSSSLLSLLHSLFDTHVRRFLRISKAVLWGRIMRRPYKLLNRKGYFSGSNNCNLKSAKKNKK